MNIDSIGVIRAVSMTLRNGENLGGYGGYDQKPGSAIERCYQATSAGEAEVSGRDWVVFSDTPGFIAFEVTFAAPEAVACRFIFVLPQHRECLEAVSAVQLLTLSPTGDELPDAEAGMFFENVDVTTLRNFL